MLSTHLKRNVSYLSVVLQNAQTIFEADTLFRIKRRALTSPQEGTSRFEEGNICAGINAANAAGACSKGRSWFERQLLNKKQEVPCISRGDAPMVPKCKI
jgi:hypothetical protein